MQTINGTLMIKSPFLANQMLAVRLSSP